jgi:hypothetical protein
MVKFGHSVASSRPRDREHPRRAGLQDRPSVATRAERAVEIDAAVAHGECRQHLAQQYRRVSACLRTGLGAVVRSQRAAALPSDDFDRAMTLEQNRSTPTSSPPSRRNHGLPNSATSARSGLV